ERKPGQVKVHVYNPEFEHHGWQSPQTVVEIVSDDMPFVVDSVTMALAREGYGIDLVIHPVIWVKRDGDGHIETVLEPNPDDEDAIAESILHLEIAREPDTERTEKLRASIERVLDEVRVAVEDWKPMRERAEDLVGELERRPPPI